MLTESKNNPDFVVNILTIFFLYRLQYVSLANIYSITDQTMNAIANYNRDLVALDIRGCWRVSDTGIEMIAEYCQNLKVLKIADCRYVKIGFNCDVQLDFSNCF